MKIILLIMNCKKYAHKAQYQKNTWLKNINIPYFHVIGDEHMSCMYKFEQHILYVKTKDDYNSLPYKVISAYEAIHQTFQYSFIFKTDDDQYLTQPNFLNELIQTLTPNIHYGGKIIDIDEHVSQYWKIHSELPKNIVLKKTQYCNGRFYILSNLAIESLLQKKALFKHEYFEDYAIGIHLDKAYMPIYKINNDVFVDF